MLLTGITVSVKKVTDVNSLPKIAQRKTIGSLQNKQGLVRNIGSKENPSFIIRYQEGFMNLVANNIPAAYKKDSLAIVFSGELKEMHPMEDEQGNFFVVNSIRQVR